jgi:Uma2 family endonuclease
MTQQIRLANAEEFQTFLQQAQNADRAFELIHGEIIEKVPTEEHGVIALWLGARLLLWVEAGDLGRVGVEIRYRLPEDQHNAYLPDIAFTSKARLLPLTRQGAVPQMPDLAVEIMSPDDDKTQLSHKITYYLANGTRLVWLISPAEAAVTIFRPDADPVTLGSDDTLDGGDVLPGFSVSVAAIFGAR